MSNCLENEIKNEWTDECVTIDRSFALSDFFKTITFQKQYTDLTEQVKSEYHFDIFREIALQLNIEENQVKCIYKLGHGSYGSVYIIESETDNQKYIIKIENSRTSGRSIEDLQKEFAMQILFYNLNFPVSTPYFFIRIESFTIIGMQMNQFATEVGMLSTILKSPAPDFFLNYLVDSIADIISKMVENSLMHGDFHLGNIGIQNTNQRELNIGKQLAYTTESEIKFISPLLIDFGFATESKEEKYSTQVELLQLIRSTAGMRIDQTNKRYLYSKFKKLFSRFDTAITEDMIPEYEESPKLSQYLNMMFEFSRNNSTKEYIFKAIHELYINDGVFFPTFFKIYSKVYNGKLGVQYMYTYLEITNDFIQDKTSHEKLYRLKCINRAFMIYHKDIVEDVFFQRMYDTILNIHKIKNARNRLQYLDILYNAMKEIYKGKTELDLVDTINQIYSLIL